MKKKDAESKTIAQSQRRDFLEKATGIVAGAGIAAVSWPFITSMNPARNVIAKATTTVDLSGIEPDEVKVVEWLGRPVFVFRRTSEEIGRMRDYTEDSIDPEPDEQRVKDPEWLVVVGLCTHLGCVPTRRENGWLCPCHGSQYDNSGRVVRGPAPNNLEVPPYRFASADRIVIGETEDNAPGGSEVDHG